MTTDHGTAATPPAAGSASRRVVDARNELADTLNAIETKVNFPAKAKRRIRELKNDNPLALGGIGLAAVAAVGAGVWLVVRGLSRR